MDMDEVDRLLKKIRQKASEISKDQDSYNKFLLFIRSLSFWYDEPMDYKDIVNPSFPCRLTVSYAICHPECGRQDLVTNMGTIRCQNCGGTFFKIRSKSYKVVE